MYNKLHIIFLKSNAVSYLLENIIGYNTSNSIGLHALSFNVTLVADACADVCKEPKLCYALMSVLDVVHCSTVFLLFPH